MRAVTDSPLPTSFAPAFGSPLALPNEVLSQFQKGREKSRNAVMELESADLTLRESTLKGRYSQELLPW